MLVWSKLEGKEDYWVGKGNGYKREEDRNANYKEEYYCTGSMARNGSGEEVLARHES